MDGEESLNDKRSGAPPIVDPAQESKESPTTGSSVKMESAQSTAANESGEAKETGTPAHKVDILLKPAGNAPIMKKKKWTVDRSKTICWVAAFIKRYIKSDDAETLFLYVNQSFAPAPDTDIGTIFDCFGSDGKLVLHYCKSQAWG